MTTAHVDTFEHDIADEIRHKEASIADIASAVGDIGNENTEEEKKNPVMIIGFFVVLFLLLGGISYGGYTYYAITQKQKESIKTTLTTPKKTDGILLSSLSPTLDQAIGMHLTGIQKTNKGYTATITSYSPVFSYMVKNEKAFAEEIANALGNTKILQEKTASSTLIVSTSTTVSTTTSTLTSSTTTSSAIIEETPQTDYIFSDITVSNQNIRIAKTIYGTVAYAFIGTQKLIIASSVENLLALRSTLTK